MNKIGIFIFRKDLRLEDNLGLINLSKECKQIIPIFILDEYQIDINNTNKYYRSNNAIQFMCESLIDLNKQLNNKLNLYKGNPVEILNILLKVLKNYEEIIISYNCDYTKYALERDNKINNLINKFKNIKILNEENDITLVPFNQLIKSNNSAYMVFGAFYKNAIKTKVNNTIKNNFKNYIKLENISKLSFNIDNLSKLYKLDIAEFYIKGINSPIINDTFVNTKFINFSQVSYANLISNGYVLDSNFIQINNTGSAILTGSIPTGLIPNGSGFSVVPKLKIKYI